MLTIQLPKKLHTLLILLLTGLLLSACNVFIPAIKSPSSGPLNSASNPVMILSYAGKITPTPFQPLPPTPAYLPTKVPANLISSAPLSSTTPTTTSQSTSTSTSEATSTKTWVDYPGPSEWPDIEIPAPMGIFPQPSGQVNLLILGSDQRPNDYGFRTDTILLLTINPKDGTAHLTSFPRDLYVYIPGWTINRVNTAMGHGGWQLLQTTFEYNFGVKPDHFILVNFWTFQDAVDNLGGVDVHVAVPFSDHRDKYGNYSVPAGVVHMDGETALWYVRARYSTSDFDRGRRQQEVLQAMFVKLLSLNGITRAPQLYDTYKRNVTTDISLGDITPLLPLAAKLDNANISHYYVSPSDVIPYRNINGAQVLIPIRDRVESVMKQALTVP